MLERIYGVRIGALDVREMVPCGQITHRLAAQQQPFTLRTGRSRLVIFGVPDQGVNGIAFEAIETRARDYVFLPVLEARREPFKSRLLPIYMRSYGNAAEPFDLAYRIGHRFGRPGVIGTHLPD